MKVEFIGGARTVTGSSYLVKTNDFTIMIDCGMFQGKRELRDRNHLNLIYAPSEIDAILLTHAHIDHSGLIPKIVKEGFKNKIYGTDATLDLCSVMLPDSAHIQEMDTEWVNKKNKKLGRDPIEPLYTVENAENSLGYFVPVKYDNTIEICKGIRARFRDAGHILGSSFIELWIEENGKTTKLVFSGDIGTGGQAIIRDPETVEESDVLFIESTYGDRLHKSKEDTYREFRDIINESHNKNGNIIIPSFAIERTQEIIYTLGKLFKAGEIPRIPVYIDSPLAIAATEIFRRNKHVFDEETWNILLSGDKPLDFPNLHFTPTTEESKKLTKDARGSIILSASGMCTAGRIKFHLQNNLFKPESSIVFVGYQAEGTLGRRIVEGEKLVRIYGEDIRIKASIHTLGGFSAHADRNGLIKWMGTIKNEKLDVFVVHGEEKASLSFADLVKNTYRFSTYVPQWGEIVDLGSMESTRVAYDSGEVNVVADEIGELQKAVDLLVQKYKKANAEKNTAHAKAIKQEISDLTEMIEMVSDEL